MQAALSVKPSAKEAWDSIVVVRMGANHIHRSTLQQWELLAFRPGEQVEDFARRLTTLKQQMALNGGSDLYEERVVEKLQRATPTNYAHLTIGIETMPDFQDLTLEAMTVGGKVLLIEE